MVKYIYIYSIYFTKQFQEYQMNQNITTAPRVRFAPSPTGYVHVGSLRTALYNYLFAKKNNGTIVLRIEDTDRKRFVLGAVENLLKSMAWAGIEFDEGPNMGGKCGPYYQSERTELYVSECQKLVDKGLAYPCFCTAERLDKMRSELMKQGKDARYDGLCKSVSPKEAKTRIAAGEKHVIRLAVPKNEKITWKDAIRGEVTFDSNLVDDQVLIKSDGYPTYHLANVIDDHYMNISHVIRGEEWVSSTPKHILLYNAFQWKAPIFAHLPLLLNPDKSKLSKRQGDVAVEDYLKKGFLPEALINFIGLLGWSPGEDKEFYTLKEMQDSFDLARVSKSGSVFDTKKLEFINAHYMKSVPVNIKADLCLNALIKAGLIKEGELDDRIDWFKKVIEYCGDRLSLPDKIVEYAGFLFKPVDEYDPKASKKHLFKENAVTALEEMINILEQADNFDHSHLEEITKKVVETKELKFGKLVQPLRIACTGSAVSFGMFEILESLGKAETLFRARQALEKVKKYLNNKEA